jgi:choline dehydrogenase-like flavoprotein
MRLLSPSIGLLVLQHQDHPTPAKYCTLIPGSDGEDRLIIDYALSAGEQARIDEIETNIRRALLRLCCVDVRTARPGHGASAHYAGTLPMSATDDELTTDKNGRLRPMRRIYVADGSVFPCLPSKGLTFTMMANADRIGCHLRTVLRP